MCRMVSGAALVTGWPRLLGPAVPMQSGYGVAAGAAEDVATGTGVTV